MMGVSRNDAGGYGSSLRHDRFDVDIGSASDLGDQVNIKHQD